MLKRVVFVALVSTAFGLVPRDAHAAAILWTLDVNATLGISGSFVFDADTGTFSNVNIVDSAFPAAYDTSEVRTTDSNATRLALQEGLGGDLTGQPFLILFFSSALTNAGGTLGFQQITKGDCLDATCGSFSADNLIADLGSVTGTTVPEPSAMLLLGAGLLAGGVRRWKQNRT